MSILSSLTIVVPSYERQFLIPRLCEYSSLMPAQIIFVDGSSTSFTEATSEYPHFNYLYVPSLEGETNLPQGSLFRRLRLAFSYVKTKYSVLMPDDEFYSPKALSKCIEFLELNIHYASCRGECYKIKDLKKYPIALERVYKTLEESNISPAEPWLRAYTHFSNYEPRHIFSITRSEIQSHFYDSIACFSYLSVFAWMEIFFEAFLCLQGPCKMISMPYQLRGVEPKIKRNKPVVRLQNFFAHPSGFSLVSEIANSLIFSNFDSPALSVYKVPQNLIPSYILFCISIYVKSTPVQRSLVRKFYTFFHNLSISLKIRTTSSNRPAKYLSASEALQLLESYCQI